MPPQQPTAGPDAGRAAVRSAAGHPRIRTFHARHGRVTPSMQRALDTIAPRRSLARRSAERPLVLEVGCGHGDAALAFADAHPEVDIVAVDVHTPGVAHLLQALEDRPRHNVWVERTDAVALLDDVIAPSALDAVHVFFPDPWPKTRHHKRRFVRRDVVDLLADRMAPGATLLFATDVDHYAASAAEVLDAHPAFVGGTALRPGWRPTAGYEAKALAAGHTVVELTYHRR